MRPYKGSHLGKSLWQLGTTSTLFVVNWWLMLRSLEVGYWLTLILALPIVGLFTRLFIIQHDCGHGSFFRSPRANHVVGFLLGVVTLTPYRYWRRTHAIHHATSGDLDHREFGDIDTLTVREYRALSRWGKIRYRIYRNMFVMLGIGSIYQFVFKHRLPLDAPREWKQEWRGVMWTNLAIAAAVLALGFGVGWTRFALVHLPIVVLSSSFGVWLFYVQHQFRGHLLGEAAGVELPPRGHRGQLLSGSARLAPLVYRQHRVPPHPPSLQPHPELLVAALHGGEPRTAAGHPIHVVAESALRSLEALGRRAAASGRLRGGLVLRFPPRVR